MNKGKDDLLEQRLKKGPTTKIRDLAEKSAEGSLSTFSGIFKLSELNSNEKSKLQDLLARYEASAGKSQADLDKLSLITSEVKAITIQAILLHGERIKKAQELLKGYKEGAFSSWLFLVYGNRQTPYNFLQYYEFHLLLPASLKERISQLPKQVIYSLAAREGSIQEKEKIIRDYSGESKEELLTKIRSLFPLPASDQRRTNPFDRISIRLKKLHSDIQGLQFSRLEKEHLLEILSSIKEEIQ